MGSGWTWLRKGLALLAAGCAAAAGAGASAPAVQGWSPDPDEQFLLDVNLRQLRLGDGVRAYRTPEGTCILLGDFIAALDVPMRVDLAAGKADGWAFREENRIALDLAAGSIRYGAESESLGSGSVRETPDGWCVESGALARWFGISVRPLTSASALVIESEAKLPVELAIERRQRAERLKPARFDVETLPQVRLPYRMWRAPVLDFVVSAGATYRADSGIRVDRRSAVRAAGEIAHLSYDAQLSTDRKGSPDAFRFRAYRSDPDGGLFGPLKATHVGIGDVLGFDSRLGGPGASGRGALVTNRPVINRGSFDRMRFEGDLPTGWEAEIYRNDQLVAFAQPTADQRYVFEDVQLFYGENRISIILYGPHGQVRTQEELINVGRDNVPSGKTWYWAGVNQPGRDLVAFHGSPDQPGPDLNAAVSVEHGIDSRTSVGALARMLLIDDERVTFVEGSVRRSIGPALVEVGIARDSDGGTAARAEMLSRIGRLHVGAHATLANDFHIDGKRKKSSKDIGLSLDAPIHVGRTVIPAHADVTLKENGDGSRHLEAAGRLSARIQRFNLATDIRYRRHYLANGPAPPADLDVALIGTGRVGDVRLRGSASATIAPESRFRSAELSAYWSASERTDWEGAVAYDAPQKRGRLRLSHIRRLDSLALALTGEAATDGSLAFGVNLNFSLDPARGMHFSRKPLAGAGVVHARLYRDLNDNGVRDPGEPPEKGALITTGSRVADAPTNEKGAVMVGGLATFTPLTVGVDLSSLPDPMLVPRKALQVVIPRPGAPAQVEIGLVGAGDIEGAVVKSGGVGFEGLDLELIDSTGTPVAAARSDYDGFFLFERVPYGTYRLRVAPASASAANVIGDLNIQVSVSPEKSIARMGAIEVHPMPRIASASD